ncbi:Aste57867_21304 [Aphanomyces stellatus]|uniref:Aste57867_21304 protein n=1 Tax=Aphanomyces stellatus TaxID=120398 RepID=A0A485LIG0_9STRA|nr:hypothetical protein As57867_021235 [Aphanomyces stellatus]VFT97976.1 Aste57867_21304 [Aphanomyces stellatus]
MIDMSTSESTSHYWQHSGGGDDACRPLEDSPFHYMCPTLMKRPRHACAFDVPIKDEVVKEEVLNDFDATDMCVSPLEMDDILSKVVLHVKHETSRDRRRDAIARRNRRRNIPSKLDGDHANLAWIEMKKRKSRIAAASYREKRMGKLEVVKADVASLLAQYPFLTCAEWVPSRAPTLACRDNESKDEFRKRKNRESAAQSRKLQLEQLQFLTNELHRLREIAARVGASSEPHAASPNYY